MARGNWQKRAELANERKISNHQRKNESNQLQALLNQYENNNDTNNEDDNKNNNNHNVLIFQSSNASSTQSITASKYCKSFFFRGECRTRKKCRLSHEISLLDSICDNDNSKDNAESYEQIALCEDAVEKAQAELTLSCIQWNSNNNSSNNNINSMIDREALVYIVGDGRLVYDRYRGGVLKHHQQKHMGTPTGKKTKNGLNEDRNNDQTNEKGFGGDCDFSASDAIQNRNLRYSKADGDNKSVKLITSIPIVVLEHILLFLPDYYIGILTQVCKSWQSIGDPSSIIWKRLLLENRNWKDATTKINNKKLFITNYCIMRNMISIQKGIQMLIDPKDRDVLFHSTNNDCGSFEEIKDSPTAGAAVQIFKSTLGSPSANDVCVSMSTMPKTTYYGADLEIHHSVYTAHQIDGSIRIFEPVADTRGKGLLCRQTACVRSILRSKGIHLIMMQMDDKYIFCVAKSSQDGIIFTTLWKDEVVCDLGGVGDNGAIDSEHFKIYHANDLVEEYNVKDNQCQNFTSSVFHVQDKSVLACGKGLFFLRLETTATDDSPSQELLCIFSARQGAFLLLEPRPLPDCAPVFSRRTEQSSCSIIQKYGRNFTIYHVTQEEDTQMKNSFSICTLTAGCGHDCLEYSNIEIIHAEQRSTRSMLLQFKTGFVEVITLDTQIKEVKVQQLRPQSADFFDPFTVYIEGNILCVDQLSDDHLVIVSEPMNTADHLNPCLTYASVIHLQSHQVVNKVYLGTRCATTNPFKYSFAYSKNYNFLACQVDCEAMILAGSEVRQILKSQSIEQRKIASPGSETKKKKKNKRLASKTGKKDGFARGMSLRG